MVVGAAGHPWPLLGILARRREGGTAEAVDETAEAGTGMHARSDPAGCAATESRGRGRLAIGAAAHGAVTPVRFAFAGDEDRARSVYRFAGRARTASRARSLDIAAAPRAADLWSLAQQPRRQQQLGQGRQVVPP